MMPPPKKSISTQIQEIIREAFFEATRVSRSGLGTTIDLMQIDGGIKCDLQIGNASILDKIAEKASKPLGKAFEAATISREGSDLVIRGMSLKIGGHFQDANLGGAAVAQSEGLSREDALTIIGKELFGPYYEKNIHSHQDAAYKIPTAIEMKSCTLSDEKVNNGRPKSVSFELDFKGNPNPTEHHATFIFANLFIKSGLKERGYEIEYDPASKTMTISNNNGVSVGDLSVALKAVNHRMSANYTAAIEAAQKNYAENHR